MKPTCTILLSLLVMTATLTGCHDENEVTLPGGWQKWPDFAGESRSYAASFVVGTKGYLFGGSNNYDSFFDLWEYDAETGGWTAMADFPGTPRTNMSCFVFEDIKKAYVCLGTDGVQLYKDLWEYDITNNVWSRKTDFPGGARHGAIGFALKGKGYILCGEGANNYSRDFYSYSPVTDTWTEEPFFPGSRRTDGAAFVYNNMAYILGGNFDLGYYLNDFWRFDPSDWIAPWHALNRLDDATDYSFDDGYTDIMRSDPAAFVLGDYGYIVMGRNIKNFGGLSTAWRYDFATDRWSRMHDFESTPRYGTACLPFQGSAMIVGGRDQDNLYKDAWMFWPNGVPELK